MRRKNQVTGHLLPEFFDPFRIAESGQCFRWQKADEKWLIPAFGKVLTLEKASGERWRAVTSPEDWQTLWAAYFDISENYEAIAQKIAPEDHYLTRCAAAAKGIRILRQPLWETVLSFIISQNNNIPRIKKSLNLLFGGETAPCITPEETLRLSEEQLRACGVGYRAPYIQKAALRFAEDGALTAGDFASYGDAKNYFMSYAGIGPKVADCICLFALGMKDAFPMDTWMKRIVTERYAGVFPLWRYEGIAGVLQQWMFYTERMNPQP